MEKIPGHNFTKSGKIILENAKERKKLPLGLRIYAFYDEPQSTLPEDFENPEKLKYYSDFNIEDIKNHLNSLKKEFLDSDIVNTIDWGGNESLPVSEIFEYIEKSISFSENVNEKRRGNDKVSNDGIIELFEEKRMRLIDKLKKKD